MAKAPSLRLQRKTRAGKAYGCWFVELKGGGRVNLRTKDAERARKRAKEAARGVTSWPDDGGGGEAGAVASAVVAAAAGTRSETPPVVEPPAPSSPGPVPSAGASPAALPPIPPAAPKNGAPAVGDAYIPPPSSPGWAAAVAAAAADTEGRKAAEDADDKTGTADADEDDDFDDVAFLRELVESGAQIAVELQIAAQEFLLARGVIPKHRIKAGKVPADNKGRVKGQEIWVRQLRKWVPADAGKIPEWMAAILITGAYTVPAQLDAANGAVDMGESKAPPKGPDLRSVPPTPEATPS